MTAIAMGSNIGVSPYSNLLGRTSLLGGTNLLGATSLGGRVAQSIPGIGQLGVNHPLDQELADGTLPSSQPDTAANSINTDEDDDSSVGSDLANNVQNALSNPSGDTVADGDTATQDDGSQVGDQLTDDLADVSDIQNAQVTNDGGQLTLATTGASGTTNVQDLSASGDVSNSVLADAVDNASSALASQPSTAAA